jgi:hypothetical protein
VVPALASEMSYDGMEVADGQSAGLAWAKLISGSLDQAESKRIRKALLGYCGQDTLGMAKLINGLQQLLLS